MRREDDTAVAAVIGAIIVLAVLGIGLVYVNAFHVPRQGVSLELDASERAEDSLTALAATLAGAPHGPLVHEVPLRIDRATPPLMAGVVMTPARAEGTLSLDAAPSRLALSVVVPAPPGGVPANDPTRESVPGGLMRVHLLGTPSAPQPLGALRVATGGSYVGASERLLEGGAVLADTKDGSASIAPPALTSEGGVLTWRLPLLAGSASAVTGASTAQLALTPGPEAALGGGSDVREVRIRLDTPRLAAWQAALEDAIGSAGSVSATASGEDSGIVEAVLTDVELRLFVVRYQVSLAERVG